MSEVATDDFAPFKQTIAPIGPHSGSMNNQSPLTSNTHHESARRQTRRTDCRIIILLALIVLLLVCTAAFSAFTFFQTQSQVFQESTAGNVPDKPLLVDCVLENASLEIKWQNDQNSESIVGQKAMISVVDFKNENVQVVNDFILAGNQNNLKLNVTNLFNSGTSLSSDNNNKPHIVSLNSKQAVFLVINQFHYSGPCASLYVYISTQNYLLSTLTCTQIMITSHTI